MSVLVTFVLYVWATDHQTRKSNLVSENNLLFQLEFTVTDAEVHCASRTEWNITEIARAIPHVRGPIIYWDHCEFFPT